ncbi:MAG: hypothetical protein V3V00_14030 [Saprospiraceae bacterium]
MRRTDTNQIELCKYLAAKLHRRSKIYQFVDIRLETSKYLLKYYSTINPIVPLAIQYQVEFKKSLRILNLESELELKYYTVLLEILTQTNTDVQYHDILNYLENFSVNIGIESSKFHLFYYHLKYIMYEKKGEFLKAIESARLGLVYFENLGYEHIGAKRIFLNSLSEGSLQLGYLTEAKQAVVKSISLHGYEDQNWINLKKLLFGLQCHTLEIDNAYLTFKELEKVKSKKSLPDSISAFIEQGQLLFYYLSLSKKLESEYHLSSRQIRTIFDSLGKKKNVNEYFTKILQLLLKIQSRELSKEAGEEISDKVLNKKNPNFRSICFIKMLNIIPKSNYHPAAVIRKTQHLRNRLDEIPFTFKGNTDEYEILPYEFIWEMVIKDLKYVHNSAPMY